MIKTRRELTTTIFEAKTSLEFTPTTLLPAHSSLIRRRRSLASIECSLFRGWNFAGTPTKKRILLAMKFARGIVGRPASSLRKRYRPATRRRPAQTAIACFGSRRSHHLVSTATRRGGAGRPGRRAPAAGGGGRAGGGRGAGAR